MFHWYILLYIKLLGWRRGYLYSSFTCGRELDEKTCKHYLCHECVICALKFSDYTLLNDDLVHVMRLPWRARCFTKKDWENHKSRIHLFGFTGNYTQHWFYYQPSTTNSKISFTVGNWHASPTLRRETAASGPSFLAGTTTSDSQLPPSRYSRAFWILIRTCSSSPLRPKRAPLQGTLRCEPPSKEKVGIFGEGCETLE